MSFKIFIKIISNSISKQWVLLQHRGSLCFCIKVLLQINSGSNIFIFFYFIFYNKTTILFWEFIFILDFFLIKIFPILYFFFNSFFSYGSILPQNQLFCNYPIIDLSRSSLSPVIFIEKLPKTFPKHNFKPLPHTCTHSYMQPQKIPIRFLVFLFKYKKKKHTHTQPIDNRFHSFGSS